MNFRNVRVPNVPGSGAAGTLVKVALIGGTAVYVALNSLYNVEGGHRAIVFNRIQGIKDKVKPHFPSCALAIALDDVSITSLSFGKEFTNAIEAKQVAAQEAERAKFIVEKAEQDKKSAIIRAQIEAAREIAHTIANSSNRVFLQSDDLLLHLQDLNFESTTKPKK
ncbi:hypothetical protein BHE74_00056878 [Ensete ventricosum]|uniref:Prohibitin n=1 Tax=Ensete ventricosum TaxID=4639 RepID=A0A444EA19_ENSVE|nr:hypothetical protein B296_00002141 [Ensete ventricosum]RWW07231.1 hypothetical protein GW17_00029397 [Ensete ventricosum]RWW37938.1 hypothetical protein BHE74_00056878 [Ensete ventricosum]RZS27699.1 hypothetical protein BHM03_00061219 [Ensete ventricosum]